VPTLANRSALPFGSFEEQASACQGDLKGFSASTAIFQDFPGPAGPGEPASQNTLSKR
jgi:hypothetical protein